MKKYFLASVIALLVVNLASAVEPPDFNIIGRGASPTYQRVCDQNGCRLVPTIATTSFSANSAPATITVSCPSETQIWLNNRPTTSTGTVRRYVTPDLPPWEGGYAYNLMGELRGQRTVKTIQVWPGVEVSAELFTSQIVGSTATTMPVYSVSGCASGNCGATNQMFFDNGGGGCPGGNCGGGSTGFFGRRR